LKPIEIKELIAAFAPAIKEYVEKSILLIKESLKSDFEKAIDEIKLRTEGAITKEQTLEIIHQTFADHGVTNYSVEMADEIEKRISAIPIPKDGIDGKDGKDADPEYIKSVIAEEVSKVPAAKDGKDADLSLVKAFIVEEVAKIPAPKDGKDGESVDIDQVKKLVSDEIIGQTMFQESPLEHLCKQIVKGQVAAALDGIPKPADGRDGSDGKDADLEIVKGFIQQEIKSIPIPKVESFTLEQVEKMVADAVAAAIANIPPAKDGEDGKDALAIQILPAIDESKSYPRGTFALHKNGTWRAYQKTVGMKGWECTQVGVADTSIEMVDDRTISSKTILSNGEIQEKTLKLKNTIYKGVVQEGATYEEGDFVTWGGSIWHCDEPTSERPREGHKSWTLAVKKGRDYREPVKSDFDPNKPVKM
jgi:hypothetical protein